MARKKKAPEFDPALLTFVASAWVAAGLSASEVIELIGGAQPDPKRPERIARASVAFAAIALAAAGIDVPAPDASDPAPWFVRAKNAAHGAHWALINAEVEFGARWGATGHDLDADARDDLRAPMLPESKRLRSERVRLDAVRASISNAEGALGFLREAQGAGDGAPHWLEASAKDAGNAVYFAATLDPSATRALLLATLRAEVG